jgi:hypothetical protein
VLDDLTDPLDWAGMRDAVTLVAAAVRRGDAILIHGDYDVDGQCAAALLTRLLRAGGADAHAFVPHRVRDGYDFGPAGLERARVLGARLIITCDCGITAVEPVRAARAAGIEVIVTDHHLPGDALPPANAVLDPRRPDCPSPDKNLCGAGVAFKLAQALAPVLGLSEHLPWHLLDYVALATVADVVPLTGENRILVRHGLKLLADSRWVGLRALVEAADSPTAIARRHVGFILAARLNAAGRIGAAADGWVAADRRCRSGGPDGGSSRPSMRAGRRWISAFSWTRKRSWGTPSVPTIAPSCWPPTTGIPASSESSPVAWWSATPGLPSWWPGRGTWVADRGAACPASTSTRRCTGWATASRSTAAMLWPRA